MSVLINLLPDLKQAKLREHHRRQLVTGVSILVWLVCGGVLVLLLVSVASQTVIMSNLTHNIATNETTLRSVSGLTPALTAQEHLSSLPSLYSQRVYMSNFFKAYIAADPTGVSLSAMAIDGSNDLSVTGSAPSYAAVAKLARAMAADNLTIGNSANVSNNPYFTNINITTVSQQTSGVNFTLSATVGTGAVSSSNGSGSNNGGQ